MNSKKKKELKEFVWDKLNFAFNTESRFVKFIEQPNWDNWRKLDPCMFENDNQDGFAQLHSGATKGVISFSAYEWVIKIPFVYNDWLEENCEDLLQIEFATYLYAKSYGVEWAFAETVLLGNFHGVPIYAAEYCPVNSDYNEDKMYEAFRNSGEIDEDEIEDRMERWNCSNREDVIRGIYDDAVDYDGYPINCLIYDYYPVDKAAKLINFIENFHIDDLHNENFSLANDKLKFIDFSGYGSGYDKASDKKFLRILGK